MLHKHNELLLHENASKIHLSKIKEITSCEQFKTVHDTFCKSLYKSKLKRTVCSNRYDSFYQTDDI